MRRLLLWTLIVLLCWFATDIARGAELQIPKTIMAGTEFSIPTNGSGAATFYLIGPSHVVKRSIKLGEAVQVAGKEVTSAGRYTAILCSSSCVPSAFFVTPAKPGGLSFLAHPSRVPASRREAISAVVFTLDKFHNLITQAVSVQMQLAVKDAPNVALTLRSKEGVAWARLDSSRQAGAARLTASVNEVSARRVVQQVAADPCNLRIRAQRTPAGIVVETDPVRDCSGNPVPDGTVVSFTKTDAKGRSTVDAPIKKGVARAELGVSGPATISVASGVVMGNEIRVEGSM